MSKNELDLGDVIFDDDNSKYRGFLINNPQNENYGDDQEEVDILEQENDSELEDFEKFENYGEDMNEVIDMETDIAVLDSDLNAMEIPDDFISYYIKVSVRTLKYFSGPGVDYKVLGYVKKDAEFIIVEESNGPGADKWGRVEKNGTAWIPLDYCERIT